MPDKSGSREATHMHSPAGFRTLVHADESASARIHVVEAEFVSRAVAAATALAGELHLRLVLATVAAWRWDIRDEFPDGHQHARDILSLLHQGPPWPALGNLAAE